MRPAAPTDLGQELVRFFEEFLPGQRGLSPNTVRSVVTMEEGVGASSDPEELRQMLMGPQGNPAIRRR